VVRERNFNILDRDWNHAMMVEGELIQLDRIGAASKSTKPIAMELGWTASRLSILCLSQAGCGGMGGATQQLKTSWRVAWNWGWPSAH